MTNSQATAVTLIEQLAENLNYIASSGIDEHGWYVKLERQDSRMITRFDIQHDSSAFISFFVRTTSWDVDGERTDLHDCLSTLFAAFLRVAPRPVSCSYWDVPHPAFVAPETEIYARYLTVDQSDPGNFFVTAQALPQIEGLLSALVAFEILLRRYVDRTVTQEGEYIRSYSYEDVDDWAQRVSRVVREPFDFEKIQWNRRANPTWKFYRSIRSNLSIYHAPGLASLMSAAATQQESWQMIDGINGRLFLSHGVNNIVSFRHINLARRILTKLNDKETLPDLVLIPFENCFVAAGGAHLLFVRKDCGRKRFEQERERIRKRHQREEEVLYPITSFVWIEQIDAEAFERLIQELLEKEKGVIWVRQTGAARERDRGKDLLCEWETPPLPTEALVEEQSPFIRRLILVQCKALNRSVGKADVRDIRDTIEDHSAQGYFLAVSSRVTSGLTDHLLRMRQEGTYHIDWWTRDQIEERLSVLPEIAAKYPTVVQIKQT
jgi:hypothetical protein